MTAPTPEPVDPLAPTIPAPPPAPRVVDRCDARGALFAPAFALTPPESP